MYNNSLCPYLSVIEDAYSKKDIVQLIELKNRFTDRVRDIHDNRIRNWEPFSKNEQGIVDEYDMLIRLVNTKTMSIMDNSWYPHSHP